MDHCSESVSQRIALCFRHESLSLQRELDGLSERYSQQCVELNRIQNSTEDRDGQIRQKERDMEQLRQENQVDRKWRFSSLRMPLDDTQSICEAKT